MRVILRAPLLTISGYGVHSRQIFEWLWDKKNIDLTVECVNWGYTSWMINADMCDGLIKKIMSCSKPIDKSKKYDLSIQVQLPDEWDISLANYNIGVSAFVETNKCSMDWIAYCNKMNHIIVPSTFTKNVIESSNKEINTDITVIPEWYNHKLLSNSELDKLINKDKRYDFDTKFNFLTIGQITSTRVEDDRKNLINTIKWAVESFKDCDDVGIILKTNIGKSSSIDKIRTESGIRQIVKEVRKKSVYPKIHLIHGSMNEYEIAALYAHKSVKGYITATRGEGYGLPIIDAAAAGIPIVATGWSGHFEYLDKELILPVDYNLRKINNSKSNRIIMIGKHHGTP